METKKIKIIRILDKIKPIKFSGNASKSLFSVALILTLTACTILTSLPAAEAHTPPWSIPMYAYLSVAPNPVGIGQAAFVNFWLDKPPPTAAGAYGDRYENLKITVNKPDGTTQVLGPYRSDAVGGAFTMFTPDQLGTYTFQFSFPGQTLAGKNPNPITGNAANDTVGDYMQPATSAVVTLIVQQQQVVSSPENPLPTGYWTRPIQSTNTEWQKISGNWLGLAASTFALTGMYNASGNFNPYTTAPNTAHIVWTKPVAFGGMIGGEFGGSRQSNYYSASQYEPKFAPIIINGVLYYTHWPGSYTHPSGWEAVDLRTGKTIWTKDTSEVLRAGQTLNYISPNQYGAIPYLWAMPLNATGFGFGGTTYYSLYEAMTGDFILNIVDAVPMTLTESEDGSLIGYFVNQTSRTLNMWNSTHAIQYPTSNATVNWMWRPALNSRINFSRGIMWTVPLATTLGGSPITPNLGISKVGSDVVLMTSLLGGLGSAYWNPGYQIEAGYSAKTGQQLWIVNRTQPLWCRIVMGPAGEGVYTEYIEETMDWTGYSLTTGQKLWGPSEVRANAWSYYGVQTVLAYGNLYAFDFGGYVNCYDIKTGTLEWTWNTGTSGYETPYGVYVLWTFTTGTVADGKLYVPGGHMYSPPLFNGAQQYALDTTSGKLVWSIKSFDVTSAPAIADGHMVVLNAYDNQIYCYSKGQSATTVSATPKVTAKGASIMIEGTITDQSPGQTCLGIPQKGTPAIADESMSAWMEYLYMQQPKPTNATGVNVKLTAVDPNGNTVDIATVTSDANGLFYYKWTPQLEGSYKISASFEGSNSYYASSSMTSAGVDPASAAPTQQPTAQPSSTIAPTIVPTATASPSPVPNTGAGLGTEVYIAIAAAAVIAIVAAAALILRKRR
jgi:hypothetical protein